MVRALVAAGAGVDQVAGDGVTPLYMSATKGHASVVAELLQNGAD